MTGVLARKVEYSRGSALAHAQNCTVVVIAVCPAVRALHVAYVLVLDVVFGVGFGTILVADEEILNVVGIRTGTLF